jgi:hypothetical protein
LDVSVGKGMSKLTLTEADTTNRKLLNERFRKGLATMGKDLCTKCKSANDAIEETLENDEHKV